MISKNLADEWMNRAFSKLERASMGRQSKSVCVDFWFDERENRCF